MTDFALSRVLRPADLDSTHLAPFLAIVDRHFTSESPQSEWRRWEYAIALAAIDQWRTVCAADPRGYTVDIGGAGSPFRHMYGPQGIAVIDPNEPDPARSFTLANYLGMGTELAAVVTCLSVIEHVPDLDRFLYHLACLVAPGGLLVLTTDCWNHGGTDTAHFHWMRERIFTPGQLYWHSGQLTVYDTLHRLGFDFFGGVDPSYPGPAFYGATGYTFASLVVRKRP